ncbi:MAG TPA: sigma 54-interacting transcriptional regulator [Polyangiaceae bacterium]|jgi:DNA-binding NtrC family response regulator|nr:sigma 54-interacting transcriptional regulator [Polyangiaceae bacterium]
MQQGRRDEDASAGESPTLATRSSATLPVASSSQGVPRLVIDVERESVHGSRRVAFQGDTCRIGTHSSNDLVLRDDSVSRFHCRLTHGPEGWSLRDSGSRNGTRIDGVRVRDADLGIDATLALGDSTLRIRTVRGEDEIASPAIRSFGSLRAKSVAMRRLFGVLDRVAPSDINVLIEGEPGTGKERVATEIVAQSARRNGPLLIVDCGGLSTELLASELFGHARGAFDGAEKDRLGAFELAAFGTVFLDEIAELPLELQPNLLRAIEAKEIERIGERHPRRIDVRIIATTHRNLEREVNAGRFREDLYFRLASTSVRIPPLRERASDIPFLIRSFLTALGVGDPRELFPASVLADLATHEWAGNVRELRNYVERAVALRAPPPVPRRPTLAPDVFDAQVPFKRAKDAVVDAFERKYVTALLDAANGNVSKAARSGGMDRMYLHRLIQKHGVRTPLGESSGEGDDEGG